ncbi:hypothetical protein ECDEC10A_0991 [Escherichia coli DEC10A]|nr:hypothetical protein ECDEC10A_0991 [Escherichia coli DEC10A]
MFSFHCEKEYNTNTPTDKKYSNDDNCKNKLLATSSTPAPTIHHGKP